MQGFGVHTSMWTMQWDRDGAARTIPAAAAYKMDFIEIALLNTAIVDADHTRALLEEHEMRAVCSLGLPEKDWASKNPEGAIEHLKVAIDKTAEMGAEALSGVTYGGIGERSGLPPTQAEYDNIARALEFDLITFADIEAFNLFLIVQRRIRDHDPADGDWLQTRHRGQRPCSTNLDIDCLERGDRFFGRKFVGNRPARKAADLAQALLPIQPVDLVDDPINIIAKIGPRLDHAAISCQQPLYCFVWVKQIIRLKAPGRKLLNRFKLCFGKWG